MTQQKQKSDERYCKLISAGRITIPAEFRDGEMGYFAEKTEDGKIVLHPAQRGN